jgi:hypothetical protein
MTQEKVPKVSTMLSASSPNNSATLLGAVNSFKFSKL